MASKFIEFLKKNNALQKFVFWVKAYSLVTFSNSKDPEKFVQDYVDRIEELSSAGIGRITGFEAGPKSYITMAFPWNAEGNAQYWSRLQDEWLQELEGSKVQSKAEAIKQWFKDQGLDEILRQEQEQSMKNFFGEKLMKERGLSAESMDEFSLKKDPDSYPLHTFVVQNSIKGPEFWKEKLQEFENWKAVNFGK